MKKKFKLLALCSIICLTACETGDNEANIPETAIDHQETVTESKSLTAKNSTVTNESALRSAVAAAVAGDVIKISGTINLTKTLELAKSGTSSSKISITGGVLNCSGLPSGSWGVKVNGSYWNITSMTIKNSPDCGLVFQTGGYNYVYDVTTSSNGDSGLQIYNGGHDNYILSCKSNDNYDAANAGENADGYACKLSAGKNNVFEKCSANHNSDDGWDLYGQPYTVTIKNCTASNNGFGSNGDGNGFKLGSAGQKVAHTVTNNTATNNLAWGYDGNGNTGHITITGSGGSGNKKGLFTRLY
ncbi:right-handed parallel beta-helix repeat-containing protein [Flavobacterium sp.]|uniref:right-handed parallel beta-helix repeat-containing protein n=1 Tax=Flavobacterium sp. TaxID=239 RepID=UPI00326554F9